MFIFYFILFNYNNLLLWVTWNDVGRLRLAFWAEIKTLAYCVLHLVASYRFTHSGGLDTLVLLWFRWIMKEIPNNTYIYFNTLLTSFSNMGFLVWCGLLYWVINIVVWSPRLFNDCGLPERVWWPLMMSEL